MGFDYFDDAETDEIIKNAFLVSLHGSSKKTIGSGYKIVLMRKGEKLQDFLNGFLQGRTVHGRPCDIFRLDVNSFLFTDDHTGVVYYVRKKGWTSQIAAAATLETDETPAKDAEISKTQNKFCLPLAIVFGAVYLRALF